jgi:acid phosphatase/vanadium-dependent haloperoxidase related protein
MLSPYLIAALLGWIIAQGSKYIFALIKGRSVRKLQSLYISGGMPSAHSATVMALVSVIGLKNGIDSGLFGLGFVFASVVMYDAMMVRSSSGKQGIILKKLISEINSPIKTPRFAKGHEPIEVLVGAVIGVAIGTVVYFATI